MAYLPIENYGLIGNMRTAALVGINGSIDWFCPQKFDAPSVFAAILDDERGGRFQIKPKTEDITTRQFYREDTNVLITRFACEDGVAEVVDYMPVNLPETEMRERWLIRRVKMVLGSLPMQMICQPAFNYAQDDHHVELSEHGAVFRSADDTIALSSSVELSERNGVVCADFQLQTGDETAFSLCIDRDMNNCPSPLSPDAEHHFCDCTIEYWRGWMKRCSYTGRWREIVYRSALAMKLMTYEPTGAIVASPTCSLPERIGGARNWDYRYTWLRDAAFTVYGFIRIGFTEEATAFIHWLEDRMHELDESGTLQIMYTIDGEHDIGEITLDHLSGYCNSTPVRLGNAAHEQSQLDIYGELMDSIYLHNKYAEPVSYDLWQQIRVVLSWVCDNWQQKDKGIWEVRGIARHFVYSKVMLWVALDRAIRLADKRSLPAPRQKWLEIRDKLYEEIMEKGWNDDIKAFTQTYHDDALDAANLIMPLVFFMSPHDPRMLSTIDAMMRRPSEGGLLADSLVYRYNMRNNVDGLEGEEGTFNMCTFWLVEALTRANRLEEARYIFEQMLGYANHLGLYAEETGPRGQALGNFPQAFTHLSLISSAYNLDQALNS